MSFGSASLKSVAQGALLAAAALVLTAPLAVAVTAPEIARSDRAEARLHADVDAIAPGEPATLALEIRHAGGWHTYWRNPGDSGEPTSIRWSAPEGVEIGPIEWPAPIRFLASGIMSYGYKADTALLSSIAVPEDWPIGVPVDVTADAVWLVCSDELCIPEQQSFTLRIPTSPTPFADPAAAALVSASRSAQPAEAGVAARWIANEEAFALDLALPELASAKDVVFLPYDWGVIDHAAAQSVTTTAEGVRLTTERGDGPATGPVGGVILAVDDSGAEPASIALAIEASPAPDGAPPPALGAAAGGAGGGGPGAGGPGVGLALGPFGAGAAGVALAALFAFAGGLILNLMPCVFPVLALKAVSLAKHGDADPRERTAQGLAYGAGVLASFLAFAAALLALKAAGASVGWGFQLQSPLVVAALAYILFAVGLNLSGVFEMPSSYAGVGGSLAARDGATGSFFTGVLAAVVASPCTAPFMGAALGYALTQSPATTIAVFAALALGFAAPIMLLSASPALARMLPKPGAWMERFRQALAFPMYAAAAWLLWVLGGQVGVDALFAALIGLVLVALAAWALGVGKPASVAGRRVAGAVAVAALIGALFALTPAIEDDGAAPARAAQSAADGGTGAPSQPYSPDGLAALQAEGRPVFLNVTADWCISCKVNERLVLGGESFRSALEGADAVYVKGDWTRRDDEITALLERFGRVGVPLYVVYPADGSAPEVLPQILTGDIVQGALRAAAR